MSNSNKSLDELLKEYQKNKGIDFLDTSLKASISFIPGISQFFNDYVKSPSTKRLEKFLAEVVQEIENLQNKNDKQINLENPSFQTTLMCTLQIASRNHQEEKINALKNAVLNSALINCIESDRQSIFLNYIDQLTPSHLKVLEIISNFSKYAEDEIIPYLEKVNVNANEIRNTIPILQELNKNEDFYNQVIQDLEDKGLVSFDDFRSKELFLSFSHKARQIRVPHPNQFNTSEIVKLLKNLVNFQTELADFIDKAKVTKLDYVAIINGGIYSLGYTNIFIQPDIVSANIDKTVTALGQSFINFIQSPLKSDT